MAHITFYTECKERLTLIVVYGGQTVERQLGAGDSSFSVSSLEMGKSYIVTIIAYRGNKRSKVAQTIFNTGLYVLSAESLQSSAELQKCMILFSDVLFSLQHITSFLHVVTSSSLVSLLYPFPMDCVQILKNGYTKSGIYTVYINNDRSKPIEAFCDMDTDGGGWLVRIIDKQHRAKYRKAIIWVRFQGINNVCSFLFYY